MSIAALICCCCANIYLTLGVSIMSLAVLICSRFFANEDHHFHPIAITGIIISSISIVIVAFIIFFYLVLYPHCLLASELCLVLLLRQTQKEAVNLPYYLKDPASDPFTRTK